MFITMLICFVCTSFACKIKNNGDKSYRKKFMRTADEKLIINKLGPYAFKCGLYVYCLGSNILASINRCVYTYIAILFSCSCMQ